MEMKEISKKPENPYDTPEKTTNYVLNVVADKEAPTPDMKEVRVGINDDDLVHAEKLGFDQEKKILDGLDKNRPHERIIRPCGYLAIGYHACPAITIPPSVPVETFAYG
ncbi:hypothetical protein TWF730_005697 [Orbilia blumenaviensis]|uniref:Uncharacterized protein n=1 Tax=Orbilia blumenaviensis TaxID=1796055 RepID=A0AAV9VL95_9PEZI